MVFSILIPGVAPSDQLSSDGLASNRGSLFLHLDFCTVLLPLQCISSGFQRFKEKTLRIFWMRE